MPPQVRAYKAKAKGAQEAHEAIRPTSSLRAPEALRGHITSDQYRLYNLIWKRFVASQMANAVFDTTAVDVIAAVDCRGDGRGRSLPPAGHRVAAALRRLPQGAGRRGRRRGLPAQAPAPS